MSKSPFDNARKIVCIHCHYERSIEDLENHCPECGQLGLVHERYVDRRSNKLRIYLWIELFFFAILVGLSVLRLMPFGIYISGSTVFLPSVIGTLLGFAGVFLFGSSLDRRGLRKNKSIQRNTWIGITISILLSGSFLLVFVI